MGTDARVLNAVRNTTRHPSNQYETPMSIPLIEPIISLFTNVIQYWLERKTAQKENLDRLMDELEQKTLGWLAALPDGQKSLNRDAPHIYAFESALSRLEPKLTDAQKTRLTAHCLNLRNLGDIQQAHRELRQLLNNLKLLRKEL